MAEGTKRGRGRPIGGKRAALAIALACGAPDPEVRARYKGKPINLEVLKGLAEIHCTTREAEAVMGMSHGSFMWHLKHSPDVREVWEAGQDQGRASLRRLQWEYAKAMNGPGAQVLIHLSKHILGQSDKSLLEMTGKDGAPLGVDNETLLARLKELTTQELQQLESTARKLGGSVPLRLVVSRRTA